MEAGLPPPVALSDDIRRQLVLDEGDAVAQLKLLLLEALELDDIGARRSLQGGNRGVEVAMQLQQARKLRPKLAFFLLRHRRLGRAAAPGWTPLDALRATFGLGRADRKLLWIMRFSECPTSPRRRGA